MTTCEDSFAQRTHEPTWRTQNFPGGLRSIEPARSQTCALTSERAFIRTPQNNNKYPKVQIYCVHRAPYTYSFRELKCQWYMTIFTGQREWRTFFQNLAIG